NAPLGDLAGPRYGPERARQGGGPGRRGVSRGLRPAARARTQQGWSRRCWVPNRTLCWVPNRLARNVGSTAVGYGIPGLWGREPTGRSASRALLGVCWVPEPGRVPLLGGWLGHAWV